MQQESLRQQGVPVDHHSPGFLDDSKSRQKFSVERNKLTETLRQSNTILRVTELTRLVLQAYQFSTACKINCMQWLALFATVNERFVRGLLDKDV